MISDRNPMIKTIDNIKEYISVSDLTNRLNYVLDNEVGEVFFQGEISELKQATSGHIYFSIKDEKSQISAVMWKGMRNSLKFIPRPGIQVLCHGKATVYHVSGKMQIVVHFMSLAGEGLLQKKFLELKEKLEKEGLFSHARKRSIPYLPAALGIITSPTGAVIHDIMVKIAERMPSQKVFLVGVRVQGEGASAEIERAIEYYNRTKCVDVIILARGGGSLEDLWAFNEERTVRAVFGSEIPIVCGVGHEVDVTLADLAADLRAPTPTAAAEFVVPKRSDLLALLTDYEKRMKNFSRWLAPLVQRVDDLSFKITATFQMFLHQKSMRVQSLQSKVESMQPRRYLELLRSRILHFHSMLHRITSRIVHTSHTRVETLGAKLEALSPLKVLERGYSITEFEGHVLKDAKHVKQGDELTIRLHKGTLLAEVEKTS